MDLKQELIDGLGVPENWDKYDYQTQRYSFDDMQEVLEGIVEKLTIPDVVLQSEQSPEFDVQEINDILKECKENKDDLQTLITRIWNKGYMTGVCCDAEKD